MTGMVLIVMDERDQVLDAIGVFPDEAAVHEWLPFALASGAIPEAGVGISFMEVNSPDDVLKRVTP